MRGEVAGQCVASGTVSGCPLANRSPPPPPGRSDAVIPLAPIPNRRVPSTADVSTSEPPSRARASRTPRGVMQVGFVKTAPRHLATSSGHDVKPHPNIMPRRALVARTPAPPGHASEFTSVSGLAHLPTAVIGESGELPSQARIPRSPRVGMHINDITTVIRHPATTLGHDVKPRPNIMPGWAQVTPVPAVPGTPGDPLGNAAGIRGVKRTRSPSAGLPRNGFSAGQAPNGVAWSTVACPRACELSSILTRARLHEHTRDAARLLLHTGSSPSDDAAIQPRRNIHHAVDHLPEAQVVDVNAAPTIGTSPRTSAKRSTGVASPNRNVATSRGAVV